MAIGYIRASTITVAPSILMRFNMKLILPLLAIAATVSGCGLNEYTGSRRWSEIKMTNTELRKKDQQICASRGLKQGTSEFESCFQDEQSRRVREVGATVPRTVYVYRH